jgi:hypothetical protein
MKNFLNELSALIIFLLSIFFFYLSFTINIISPLVNVFVFIIAIFVLIKSCDRLDKELGIGEYKDDDKKENN